MEKMLTRLTIGLTVLLAIPPSVVACAPEEIRAFRSATCVVAGEIMSVVRGASTNDLVTYTIKVKPDEVLYGNVSTGEILNVEMSLWKPKEDPTFESGERYVVYLREATSNAPSQSFRRWLAKYGTTSIQPDTEKLREMLMPCIEQRVATDKKPREVVDVAKLSPIDKKMNSIVLPEVDFMCANISDAVCFFNFASIEYDHSPAPRERKGVNIVVDPRMFLDERPLLINYYLEGGTLLQNVDIAAAIIGERYALDDWIVISRKGSGPPKPAISLGPQGTNSVLYKKLSAAVIPEVDFRQAGLQDVAKFLAEAGNANVVADISADNAGAQPPVTLQGNHVSVMSVLRILTALCPFEVFLDEKSATIRPVQPRPPADIERTAPNQ
jgi:hypothetical protein